LLGWLEEEFETTEESAHAGRADQTMAAWAGSATDPYHKFLDNCWLGNYSCCVSAPMTENRRSAASDLKRHTGFWLRFVSNHVSHAFARKVAASGVTVAEWVILREMYGHDEVSPSAIATQTGLTRGTVSKLIDRLLAKKLVTREDRTDDRRFQSVALTAEGKRLVPKLAALADRNDLEFFSVLTEQEREALTAALKRLVTANKLTKVPVD
jgi:DNA-binding MarR family transcriptional regulator